MNSKTVLVALGVSVTLAACHHSTESPRSAQPQAKQPPAPNPRRVMVGIGRGNFPPGAFPPPRFPAAEPPKPEGKTVTDKVIRTDDEWRKILPADVYRITRERGTEPAFTGKYSKTKTPGVYECACCGLPLFDSDTKYESHTGWPSFWKAIDDKNIGTETDQSHGVVRTEVHCSRCEAHLGHVFKDGPAPTGLRYCINTPALKLVERDQEKK